MTSKVIANIHSATSDMARVCGLTHRLYQYPAKFSPNFAREIISLFSKPGDVVLDPFVGGGTTIVEGYSLGRRTIGIDINSLATFITKAKTVVLDANAANTAIEIGKTIVNRVKITSNIHFNDSELTNFSGELWRVRKILGQMRTLIQELPDNDVKTILLSSLVRVGQLAIDRKRYVPSINWLRSAFVRVIRENAYASCQLQATRSNLKINGFEVFQPIVIGGDAESVLRDYSVERLGLPKLVLTSPPYPGVHVLYHRWQVFGRKETNAPYWLANIEDGKGASHYTFGDRNRRDQLQYFEKLLKTFQALRKICDRTTVIVQLVGFSKKETQLPLYLETMARAGFSEGTMEDGSKFPRVERIVPNRRWYTRIKEDPNSTELLLIHTPK